jgi:hypothetical protein
MHVSHGGLTEEWLLKMPYTRFLSYCESVSEQNQEDKELQYFNGSQKLANIWQGNKSSWQQQRQVS